MIERLVDFFFPAQCAACNAAGSGLCERCVPLLPGCVRHRLKTIDVRALGEYRGAYRRSILALKDGRRDVAVALAERLASLVPSDSLLLPVPTTPARRRVRGMDNVRELARLTALYSDARAFTALRRCGVDAQRGRSRTERLAARNRFACDGAMESHTYVLLDDVCTTGATLEDCARVVRAAGGRIEEAVVVALA
ncbi:MAG: hypothetical protein M3N13_11085 [Candidatus Eremiobacteraeota bacterium]|nr:hypothetical protein [Candidatus Eremiobacteraeota bacterium]